jgi:pyroglutamyl-peptidase
MVVVLKALVAGFSYYGGYWNNPSGEVARRLDGVVVEGLRVRGLVLPVSFRAVKAVLREALYTTRPIVVIGLGLNPVTHTVDVELVAVNRAFFTQPDIEGYVANYEAIDSEGPLVAYTTLPVQEILEECRVKRGLPVKPSLHTGLYLCNTAAYLIMRYGLESKALAGFIHLPPSTINYLRGETSHGIPLQELIESTECILEVSAKKAKNT